MRRVNQIDHGPADRLFDIDRRVMAGIRQCPREDDVAVEDGARRVGDRILLVIAFGQHRIESRDRAAALFAVAGTFDQLRQLGKYRRRVTAGGRWFADGQCNFALCHGVAGQRIHDQQDLLALVTKILGDGGGVSRTLQAHQRAGIGRRGDNHGATHAFLTEDVLDEFLDLAAAFADQPDHDHFGLGVARHHAEEHRFAHPGTGKQPHALATPNRKQGVDGANADIKRLLNCCPRHRVNRPALQGAGAAGEQRPFVVERAADAIEHPSQQLVADRALFGTIDGSPAKALRPVDRWQGTRGFAGDDLGAGGQSEHIIRGHQVELFAGEANNFGLDRGAAHRIDVAGTTQGEFQAGSLHDQAVDAGQAAHRPQGLGVTGRIGTVLQEVLPAS